MKRKFYDYLLNWKQSENRMPLIVQGARQIGKTYTISEFGKNEYTNFVYCNLEYDPEIKQVFEGNKSLDPYRIIDDIANIKGVKIEPAKTLLILDEIQACPIAITSLKYFNELANQFHVIASGSLLGVSINRNKVSFPVGKVTIFNLNPMDFEEFLWAVSKDDSLTNIIKSHYETNTPMPLSIHTKLLDLYKDYLFIGGMPNAINEYISTSDPLSVSFQHNNIINQYINDMAKYNSDIDTRKTRMLFNNIPSQLAKENKKFKYSFVLKGSRSRDFEDALEWLLLTGIASKVNRVEQCIIPLKAYEVSNDFKIYMNDIGLCGHILNLEFQDIKSEIWQNVEFKGGLTENYVFNHLLNNGLYTFFWRSKFEAEVDFIVRIDSNIIPIEVKSNENVKSRGLNIYSKQYKPKYSIRISAKNFGFENNIKSVPLYAVFCIK